jgi:hypothetical protein
VSCDGRVKNSKFPWRRSIVHTLGPVLIIAHFEPALRFFILSEIRSWASPPRREGQLIARPTTRHEGPCLQNLDSYLPAPRCPLAVDLTFNNAEAEI